MKNEHEMLPSKFGSWFPRWEVQGLRHETQNDPEGEISPDPKISLLGKWQCKLPHWGLNLLACGCALLWEISWSWWTLWLELECCDASTQDCLCNGMQAVHTWADLYFIWFAVAELWFYREKQRSCAISKLCLCKQIQRHGQLWYHVIGMLYHGEILIM